MALLFLALVAVLELARALPLLPAFRDMSLCGQRSLRVMRRGGVSERLKERAMQILARRLFGKSLRAGVLLLVAASPLLLVFALEQALDAVPGWNERLQVMPLTLGYALLRWQVVPALRRRVQPR